MLGRKLNFLNIMFINIFFYESVVGCVMIPNFFSIGIKNLIGTVPLINVPICGLVAPVPP